MLQQISSNKKIYACPHVGAPFLWGPLCGRTGRTCLNPPLRASRSGASETHNAL